MDKNKNTQQGAPLVSIRCLVYNHEPFLRQCLDGFMMQQTTFPFEAIVHDDASTDGSAAIIREYAEKYPDIIKPIYETENQYSKHDGSIRRAMDAVMHPESKYIATCEGDDYWTDPNKLQIQVDFLESHPDYFVTSHDISVYNEETKIMDERGRERFMDLTYEEYNGIEYHTFTKDDYFKIWFMHTVSMVRRKEPYIDKDVRMRYPIYYDYIDFYYIIKKGKCAFLKNIMATYRRHKNGVSTGSRLVTWNSNYLKNNYILFNIEKERLVLPDLNSMFVSLFIEYLHEKNYNGALNALYQHQKNISTNNTIYCFWLLFRRFVEIISNGITGMNKYEVLKKVR